MKDLLGASYGSSGFDSEKQEKFDEEIGELMTLVLQDLDVAGAVDAFNIPL